MSGVTVGGVHLLQEFDQLVSGVRVAVAGGMFVELGRVTEQSALLGCSCEGVQVVGAGACGGCGPESGRGNLIGAVVAAMLFQVVG